MTSHSMLHRTFSASPPRGLHASGDVQYVSVPGLTHQVAASFALATPLRPVRPSTQRQLTVLTLACGGLAPTATEVVASFNAHSTTVAAMPLAAEVSAG